MHEHGSRGRLQPSLQLLLLLVVVRQRLLLELLELLLLLLLLLELGRRRGQRLLGQRLGGRRAVRRAHDEDLPRGPSAQGPRTTRPARE